jgi:toxin-antitoxin system PIN domain toxin
MSYAIDVNVLLHAVNAGSRASSKALTFLEECSQDSEALCLTWSTLMGFVRMATHASIFAKPLTPAEATGNVAGLLALPHTHVLVEKDGFLDIYLQITDGHAVRGNLVPDAHLAALLKQHGVSKLYSTDRDFRRFDFLDVENPLA